MKSDFFRITAIRLVEFHNLGTTTVEIPNGGHLFLLGDNGSGKTTLLDAVHLVLTAGRDMEFNSAARVAGSKDSGGRTIQGIVLRYNASKDRPDREAGITYAALELTSDAGKKFSLAVGLSASGMDVAFERWGGMAAVPVSELLLTVEECGRVRAARADEFKRAMSGLPGGRAFAHISEYQKAVGEKLFGGLDKYADSCKLLKTGKAYREIAARAANYDELFRSLLEDPSQETFEPLLKGLRELEESRNKLNDLDERSRYLDELVKESAKLSDLRNTVDLVSWAEADRLQTDNSLAMEALGEAIAAGKDECQSLEEMSAKTKSEAEQCRERIATLRAKDSSGLLMREKSAIRRVADADSAVQAAEDELGQAKVQAASTGKRLRDSRATRQKSLARTADDLMRKSKGTGVVLGAVTDVLLGVPGEDPASSASDFASSFTSVQANLEPRREDAYKASLLGRQRADDARAKTESARLELETIRSQPENLPEVAGFAAAREKLREQMLNARPLYELLEPSSACDSKMLALLERLVGADFLSTWITDEAEADTVRGIVWRQGEELSVAIREAASAYDPTMLAPWLRHYISFENSDVAAVRLLARHLSDSISPEKRDFLSKKIWAFRGREGLLQDSPPKLIGTKARAEEQARRERVAEQAFASAEREQRQLEKIANDAEKLEGLIRELERSLSSARDEASEMARLVLSSQAAASRVEEALSRALTRSEECRAVFLRERGELEDIQVKMRAEGVDSSLEKRIAEAERSLKSLESKSEGLDRDIGAVRNRISSLSEQRGARERTAKDAGERVDLVSQRIAVQIPEGTSVPEYVRHACPAAFAEGVDFARLRNDFLLKARDSENAIVNRIRDPKGELYGFDFDEKGNRIADRRGVDLGLVVADEERRLDELRNVINEKSREVFERIFMGEVMQRLYVDLLRIEDLVRRVQRLLKGRRFGSNRYDFVLKPMPEYETFVRLIRNGSRFDSEDERNELRDYLDTRRDEIMNAEIGSIPDVFDYRKWFSFALKVFVENDEGMVIDRKVKSVGSGGEQAVPNYLLILTVAEFLYHGGHESDSPKMAPILFDEAFYGIDAARRDQLLAFAEDLGLQLFVSSPDQDGVKKEIRNSVSLIVVKDENLDVHLSPVFWKNAPEQDNLFEDPVQIGFSVGEETR